MISRMNKPLIMGIVNVTPDSFSDGGKYFDPKVAVEHGLKLIKEGAEILDIGGESTRPNAEPVAIEEEIERIVPVIRELSKTGKVISVDTRNTKTMTAALEAGAGFINDITALQDNGAIELAAQNEVEVCLMHMQGAPQTMQSAPQYDNVVQEVYDFLQARIKACISGGIQKEKIYADIGIGFGKTLEHNLDLLRNLDRFHELGVKLLLGTSRKKFIEKIMDRKIQADQRLGGSLATALWGMEKGVHIVRVHDVAQTAQAINVWSALSD
ncbi:MAG: dihydropteroate synthase [Micavibrio aeruginosavorus]|uniref:Dihydropteroate synthase n=1 Tax=Micavibrio aeruginosavorus TaxID=349221 RepID=A0A2W5HHY1_9BACT|nr:MAG: dihydropteroate synthase [Micavibrio aeruginosavorus]